MATTLWLDDITIPITSLGSGHVLKATGAAGDWAYPHGFSLVELVGSASPLGITTVAGPASLDLGGNGVAEHFVSAPLKADVTISGNIDFHVYADEANALANARMACAIYKVSGTDFSQTLISDSQDDVEISTASQTLLTWTATPTSTNLVKGDRLRVCFYIKDFGTMAAGYGVFLYYGGGPALSCDSYLTFSDTLSFFDYDADPRPYRIHLRNLASAVSTADVDLQALSAASVSTGIGPITNSANGYTTGVQCTDTAGGTSVSWFTNQLGDMTLTGWVRCSVCALWGTIDPYAAVKVELAVVNSDGTGAVVWGVGITTKIGPSNTSYICDISASPLSVSAGKRLRIRLFLDDCETDNGAFPSKIRSGGTVQVYYNGSNGGAYDTYLDFPMDLTPQYPTPPGATHAVRSS